MNSEIHIEPVFEIFKDKDLETFLSVGSFGNLQKLNLSFTDVSSDSAEVISKLPALQHLNLWSSRVSHDSNIKLVDYKLYSQSSCLPFL